MAGGGGFEAPAMGRGRGAAAVLLTLAVVGAGLGSAGEATLAAPGQCRLAEGPRQGTWNLAYCAPRTEEWVVEEGRVSRGPQGGWPGRHLFSSGGEPGEPGMCRYSEWSEWGGCSEGCGRGSRARNRTLLNAEGEGSESCTILSQTQACSLSDCVVLPSETVYRCPLGMGRPVTSCPLHEGSLLVTLDFTVDSGAPAGLDATAHLTSMPNFGTLRQVGVGTFGNVQARQDIVSEGASVVVEDSGLRVLYNPPSEMSGKGIGTFYYKVCVRDDGSCTSLTSRVQIDVSSPPAIHCPSRVFVNADSKSDAFSISARDVEGDALSFSLDMAPQSAAGYLSYLDAGGREVVIPRGILGPIFGDLHELHFFFNARLNLMSNQAPGEPTTQMMFSVSDGIQSSPKCTVRVHVNNAPVAHTFEIEIERDSELTFELAGEDRNGDPLTARILNVPKRLERGQMKPFGILLQAEVNADGTGPDAFSESDDDEDWGVVKSSQRLVRYIPEKGKSGRPYFCCILFKVYDQNSASMNTGRVKINVNSPPTVPSGLSAFQVRADSSTQIALRGEPTEDPDIDGDEVTAFITSISHAGFLTMRGPGGNILLFSRFPVAVGGTAVTIEAPSPSKSREWVPQVTIGYRLSDGKLLSDSEALITLNVNRAPEAEGAQYSMRDAVLGPTRSVNGDQVPGPPPAGIPSGGNYPWEQALLRVRLAGHDPDQPQCTREPELAECPRIVLTSTPEHGVIYALGLPLSSGPFIGKNGVPFSTGDIVSNDLKQVLYSPMAVPLGSTEILDGFRFKYVDEMGVSSGDGVIEILVQQRNQPPEALPVKAAHTAQGNLALIQLQGSDPEGQALGFYVTSEVMPTVNGSDPGTLFQYSAGGLPGEPIGLSDPCSPSEPCFVTDGQGKVFYRSPESGAGNPYCRFRFAVSDGELFSLNQKSVEIVVNSRPTISDAERHVYTFMDEPVLIDLPGTDAERDSLSRVLTSIPGHREGPLLYRVAAGETMGDPIFPGPAPVTVKEDSVWFSPPPGQYGQDGCCRFPGLPGTPDCADIGLDPYELNQTTQPGVCTSCGPGKPKECALDCDKEPKCQYQHSLVRYKVSDGQSYSDTEAVVYVHVYPRERTPKLPPALTALSHREAPVNISLTVLDAGRKCIMQDLYRPPVLEIRTSLNETNHTVTDAVQIVPGFSFKDARCSEYEIQAVIVDGPHKGDLAPVQGWLNDTETPEWNRYGTFWHDQGNLTTAVARGLAPSFMTAVNGTARNISSTERLALYTPRLSTSSNKPEADTSDSFSYALMDSVGRVLRGTVNVDIAITRGFNRTKSRFRVNPEFDFWLQGAELETVEEYQKQGAKLNVNLDGWIAPKEVDTMYPHVYGWGNFHFAIGGLSKQVTINAPEIVVEIENDITTVEAAGTRLYALSDNGVVYALEVANSTTGEEKLLRPQLLNTIGIYRALEEKVVVSVKTSPYHTLALTSEGEVYSWGDNSFGQLGRSYSHVTRPEERDFSEASRIALLPRVVSIACGHHHSMALTAEGDVYTWGSNQYGQLGLPACDEHENKLPEGTCRLGDRTRRPFEPVPKLVTQFVRWGTVLDRHDAAGVPVLHLNGARFQEIDGGTAQMFFEPIRANSISSGPYSSYCISTEGQVYSWGLGTSGQLGHAQDTLDRVTSATSAPFPVLALKGVDVLSVSASQYHAAALSEAGRVYTWGSNLYGQLGLGDHKDRLEPELVAELLPYNISEVSLGSHHSIAADDYGRTFIWGSDLQGQLGNLPGFEHLGTEGTLSQSLPRQLMSMPQAFHVSAGEYTNFVTRMACPLGTKLSVVTGLCTDCGKGTAGRLLNFPDCFLCSTGEFGNSTRKSQCEPCEAGSYNRYMGMSSCFLCKKGMFSPIIGADSESICMECSPGTHSPQEGATTCLLCPPGTFQDQSGKDDCIQCPEATFQPNEGSRSPSDCLLCPPGTFMGDKGSTQCEPCPPGYFTGSAGATLCEPCPYGTFASGPGTSECTPCPEGTFMPETGASSVEECVPCGQGYFSNTTGALKCRPCPRGTYSSGAVSSECTPCPPGTYGTEEGLQNRTQCTLCPRGTASSKYGAVPSGLVDVINCKGEQGACVCDVCSPGTFADEAGQSSCTPCPAGTYGMLSGSVRAEFCFNCDVGYFAHEAGLQSCLPCPPGSYVNTTGNSECDLCPPGSFMDNFGGVNITVCAPCPAGSYTDVPGTGECKPCAEGTYNPLPGATSCQKCPAGSALAESNATSHKDCLPCMAGTYGPEPGMSSCLPCEPGYFSDEPEMLECLPCEPGTFLPLPGGNSSESCEPCSPGTIAALPGSSECTNCTSGQYQEEPQMSVCDLCPKGTYLPFSGSFSEEDCLPCTSDPVGTHGPEKGLAECVVCPPGSYADEAGLSSCKPAAGGSYIPVAGANDSEAFSMLCGEGQYADEAGLASCKNCPIGHYGPGEGLSECTPCPAGTFSAQVGATDSEMCQDCGPGTRSPTGSGKCMPCAPGTYGPNSGAEFCEMCPPGTFAPYVGQVDAEMACLPCEPGTFNDIPGKSKCRPCSVGTFGNATALIECTPCDAGYFLDEPGASVPEACQACTAGSFSHRNGSDTCAPCPQGTFNPETAQVLCQPCPKGTFGQEKGARSVERCDKCPRFRFSTQDVVHEDLGFALGGREIQDCFYEHLRAAKAGPLAVMLVTLALLTAVLVA